MLAVDIKRYTKQNSLSFGEGWGEDPCALRPTSVPSVFKSHCRNLTPPLLFSKIFLNICQVKQNEQSEYKYASYDDVRKRARLVGCIIERHKIHDKPLHYAKAFFIL